MSVEANVSNPRAVARDVFSATLGSVCCCYTGQPFDTVKVRMQTSPLEFKGFFGTSTKIIRNEGIAALWKGAVPTAVGMAMENAMAFGVNEALKRAFPDEERQSGRPPSLARPFAMGAITGCCSGLVLIPSEVVKCKLQVVVGKNVSSKEIISKMIRQQGIKSMFIGFDAQMSRDATFYALFFGGYEMSCYLFRTYVPSMPDELNYFISGGLAGMVGWAIGKCETLQLEIYLSLSNLSWASSYAGKFAIQ